MIRRIVLLIPLICLLGKLSAQKETVVPDQFSAFEQMMSTTKLSPEERTHLHIQFVQKHFYLPAEEHLKAAEFLYEYANTSQVDSLVSMALNSKSVAYTRLHKNKRAYQALLENLELARSKSGNYWKIRELKVLLNLSCLNYSIRNVGLDYNNLAFQQMATAPPQLQGDILWQRAKIYTSLNELDSALYYIAITDSIYSTLPLHPYRCGVLDFHAFLLLKKKEDTYTDLALAKFKLADSLHAQLPSIYQSRRVLNLPTLINVYLKTDQEVAALERLNDYKKNNFVLSDSTALQALYESFARVFEAQNQLDSALVYYKKYYALENKKVEKSNRLAISALENQFKAEQLDQELKLQKKQKLILAIGLTGLIIILFLLAYGYKVVTDRNQKISTLYQKYQAQTQIKESLISIFLHDFRGPLAKIRQNLFVLSQQNENLPFKNHPIINDLKQTGAQLEALSFQIFKTYLEQGDLEGFEDFKNEFKKVISDLNEAFSIPIQYEILTLLEPGIKVKAGPVILKEILFNIVQNAIQHNDNVKQIDIQVINSEPEKITLKICDYGKGFDASYLEKFNTSSQNNTPSRKTGQSNSGLGLKIIRDLLKLLDGEMILNNDPVRGAQVHIFLKKY